MFLDDERNLHSKYGLPLPAQEERELGTGGPVQLESRLLMGMSPVFEKMADLKDESSRLQRKLVNNKEAFTSLAEYIGQKQSAWRFIPSIPPTQGRYGSAFGPRIHPVTGEVGKMHYGVDISNDRWTPIFASADGVVDIAQFSSSFGNYVAINHGNGIVTRYGHMQMSLVHPGQFVRRYQLIGYIGSTGRSTGPHLHYEVWVNKTAVNPLAYMLPGDYAVD
jgi:murein DD-endopeptidase MepM/ murein hydrolase activator NlpD